MDAGKGVVRMNCRNCGAPMKNGRCEYCGTQVERNVSSTLVVTGDAIRLECKYADSEGAERTEGVEEWAKLT